MWALGVITTELLLGHLPFNGATRESLFKKILDEEADLSGGPKRMMKGGAFAKEFIKKCL